MNLQLFSNQLNYETFREVEKDGEMWLVVNGVPLIEGVLNGFLVPFDEFGAFPSDWNDMPIVLNHPSENGGSARVASPDVPVIGRFHNTTVDKDGRRLTGEFWLKKNALLATDQGPDLYEKMKLGLPIEISTGYFSPGVTLDHGKFKGKEYQGIHKGIHPDHIAILTNQIGACSLMDGCGLNRNSAVNNCDTCPAKVIANMTGNLPAEGKKIFEEVFRKCKTDGKDEATAGKIAWSAVEKAGWSKDDNGKWMKHNEESMDREITTIRDAFYAAVPAAPPEKVEMSGYIYQKEKDVYVFAPREAWKKVEQTYVDKNQQSANKSPDWFAKAKSILTKEFLMQNKVLKAFLHALGFEKVVIEDEGEGLSLKLEGTGDEKVLAGLLQLNSVVAGSGGADEFAKTLESLKGLPATVAGMQKQMTDALALMQNAVSFAESAATKVDAAKKGLIAGLVQNKACPFDEATLNTMSLDILEKLDTSYQAVDYTGLGAGLFQNTGDETPLALPMGYLAKKEKAEA